MTLEIFWFLLVGTLLTMYAILDGFDLGVGVIHLSAKTDQERRLHVNAIGPVWDGNEVWLVTFGGALLGAFPKAFALIFSAHYTQMMLVMMALVFRAVSLEFRSKSPDPRWRKYWDTAFSAASTILAFLFGSMVGNAITGLPIDADGRFVGSFHHTVGLFSTMTGVMSVLLFALHGSIFLIVKTEGELQERIIEQSKKVLLGYVGAFLAVSCYAILNVPYATESFMGNIHLNWIAVGLNVFLLLAVRFSLKEKSAYRAFVLSSLHIATLTMVIGAILFPSLIKSSLDPSWHLTIYNACSSHATLTNMARIAILGAPLAILYTVVVYWLFRGKVQLDEDHSY